MCFHDDNPTLSPDIWSQLPTELTREILLHIALSSPARARTLRLVSRHANVWVLPLLFRALVLTTPAHITRFAATLLPKRRLHIPALRSALHTLPRPLASYAVDSLALVANTRLPSAETALASVAPALTRLTALAITGQGMSAHAYWLRAHPVRPRRVLLLHFGSPQMVDFREPVFAGVTHLYTAVLVGLRGSSVAHVPNLTHLAAHARIDLAEALASRVAQLVLATLESLPELHAFVLVLNSDEPRDPRLAMWARLLDACRRDARFTLLPFFRHPRTEWAALLSDEHTVWDRAHAWRRIESEPSFIQTEYAGEMLEAVRAEHAALPGRRHLEAEWEVDLVEREGFHAVEADPTERLYKRTPFPRNIEYHT